MGKAGGLPITLGQPVTQSETQSQKKTKQNKNIIFFGSQKTRNKETAASILKTSLLCKNSPGRGKANDGFCVLSTEPVWPRVNILIMKVAGQNKEQSLGVSLRIRVASSLSSHALCPSFLLLGIGDICSLNSDFLLGFKAYSVPNQDSRERQKSLVAYEITIPFILVKEAIPFFCRQDDIMLLVMLGPSSPTEGGAPFYVKCIVRGLERWFSS